MPSIVYSRKIQTKLVNCIPDVELTLIDDLKVERQLEKENSHDTTTRNVTWQAMTIRKQERSLMKNQKPRVLWFTGYSGSGKSTIANLVETALHKHGKHTFHLDGDNLRHGLNKDLGFSDEDRTENIRRVAEVSKLMVDAGLVVITSFISPFKEGRNLARALFADDEFIEIFVDTPIEECARRDPKGLYHKVAHGEIKNFTGISSSYERPENPELTLATLNTSPADMAKAVVDYVRSLDSKATQ